MAFDFIKKVFSFGQQPGSAEPQPAQPEQPPQPARPEVEPSPPEVPPAEHPGPAQPPPPAPEHVPEPPASTPAPTPPEIPQPQQPTIPGQPPLVDAAPHPHPASGSRGSPALSELEAPTPKPPSPGRSRGEGKGEGQHQPSNNEAAAVPTAGRVTVGKRVEERAAPEASPPEPASQRRSWFQRLRDGLSRSSRELSDNISGVFIRRRLDDDTLQHLEDVLIRADLGMETALRVTEALASGRYGRDVSDAEVKAIMAAEVEKVLTPVALPLELDLSMKPHVILVVGVNGTGKTTTIGKLSAKLTAGGLKVTLAAGDTFRAAAIEQLKIWGERTGSEVVASKLGADAAGLAFEAFEKAKVSGSDVLIIDTAGRLQNKAELMAELEKIVRVLGKHNPEAPHTVLQTVDATTGQNALNQVEIFRNVAGVNGLVMTKLDGTARGGILVAIAAKYKLPVYFIGVGEQVDDLEPFSAGDFARAIAGVN
jgi:fused signal recognition particle receptor